MTHPSAVDHVRRFEALLTVRRPDGSPCTDTEVLVEQVSHDFSFGNIGFDFVGLANEEQGESRENVFGGAEPEAAERLEDLWLDLFNTATLPFYWAGFEPVEGQPDTRRLQAAAAWFRERGVSVKGHPLVWHTLAPDWLRRYSDEDVEKIVRARIQREVTSFSGLVDTWDAINEVVIMPVFENEDSQNAITRLSRRIGRIPTIRLAFEEARRANPATTLILNDFNLSTAYECLVEGVLEAGVQVDAIGLQSHMHQGYWGEQRTLEVLERFARYGLPLHWTETTLVSGDVMPPEIVDLNDHQVDEWPSTPEGEERQADEIVRHYRTLLADPSVEAVTYWGLTDRGAWLGAPAGLVRADGTPKPGYEALRGLVKGEWWLPPTRLRTDDDGRVRVRGWAGDYTVSAGDSSGSWTLRHDVPSPEVNLA